VSLSLAESNEKVGVNLSLSESKVKSGSHTIVDSP